MPKNLVNSYFFTIFALFKNITRCNIADLNIGYFCIYNFRDKRYFINTAPSVVAETPTKVCVITLNNS